MNIILNKDGTLSINDSPLQGQEAGTIDNLVAFISNPQDGDAIVYDATAGIWKAGSVGGGSGGGVTVIEYEYTADGEGNIQKFELKTKLEDIIAASKTGILMFYFEEENSVQTYMGYEYDSHESLYSVYFANSNGGWTFYADTLDDYPEYRNL